MYVYVCKYMRQNVIDFFISYENYIEYLYVKLYVRYVIDILYWILRCFSFTFLIAKIGVAIWLTENSFTQFYTCRNLCACRTDSQTFRIRANTI